MNPRERIATIIFIEQLKHTEAEKCRGIKYNDLVLRKEEKSNVGKKNSQRLQGRNL